MIKISSLIKDSDYNKLTFLSWTTLITLWIYVYFSGDYITATVTHPKLLEVCTFIDNNIILVNIVKLAMYYFSSIIVTYSILQKKLFTYKPILFSIVLFAFWLIKTIFINIPIINLVDFVYFIFLGIICRRKWYRALIGCIMTLAFSAISGFVKGYCLPEVNSLNIPIVISFVLSIDIYLMCFIYYFKSLKRKEGSYEQPMVFLQVFKEVENYFRYLGRSISNLFRRNRISSSEVKSKVYDYICGIIFFCITYFSLLIVGILFDRSVEMSLSVLYFHIFRGNEKDTYHCKTDVKCWCLSMCNFLIIQKLGLPIHISFLTTILFAFILCIVMRLLYKINEKQTMSKKKRILAVVENNETKIEKFCKKLGIPEVAETVYFFLNNTVEETAEWLGISVSTVKRRINKFIKISKA